MDAAVQIAAARTVRMVQHALVLSPIFQAGSQPAGDRPKAGSADPGPQRHRMRHEPADTAVSVWERMDVVEAVVRRGDPDDTRAGRFLRGGEPPSEDRKSTRLNSSH